MLTNYKHKKRFVLALYKYIKDNDVYIMSGKVGDKFLYFCSFKGRSNGVQNANTYKEVNGAIVSFMYDNLPFMKRHQRVIKPNSIYRVIRKLND